MSAAVVDVNVPRFNQSVIAVLTGVGFVLNQPALVFIAFAILFASRVFGPKYAPLSQLFVRFIRPRLARPVTTEDSRPPAFAQLLGTLFLGSSVALFLVGLPVVAWALSVVVTALAALAAVANICVGCVFYEKFLEPARV